jgi:hypothetical protein
MDDYELLNIGPGSPGDVTRTITSLYLDLKIPFRSNKSVMRKILTERGERYYQILGENILDSNLIFKTLEKSNGNIPFAIFIDIIVTNKASGNLDAVYENIDLVTEVVLNNFNRMVPPHKGTHNASAFKRDIMNFIREECL